MNNKFINNNGVNLLHTSKKPVKTKVESQIEMLKQQEQEMITELSSWETKQKKAEQLIGYLEEVNEFSTNHLAEAVDQAKKQKNKHLTQPIVAQRERSSRISNRAKNGEHANHQNNPATDAHEIQTNQRGETEYNGCSNQHLVWRQ